MLLLKPDPDKSEPKNIRHTRQPSGRRNGTKDIFIIFFECLGVLVAKFKKLTLKT
jgi:hypothetical protein